MMKKFVILLLFFSTYMYGIFEYDKAASLGRKGSWEQAADVLKNVPSTSPDIFYDKGVIAHHNKDFSTAKECFLSAAGHPEVSVPLCEQALFNVGNACCALQELENAIEYYKKVLEQNSENIFAQHNLKKVEEMLKKKQEEKKQQQQQKEDKEDKKDKQQQKKEQEKQEKNEQSQNKKDDSQKNGGGQQEQPSGKNDEQQKKQNEEQSEQNKQKQKQQEENKQKTEQQNGEKQQEQEQKSFEQQQQDNEQKQENSNAGLSDKDKQQKQKAHAAAQKTNPASHDEWLATMLEKSEKRDAQGNKKMIKAMVQQQMRGNEGQNCW